MPQLLYRLKWLLFVVLCLAGTAQIAQAQPGPLTGFAFMRLEPSARAAALGGSFTAVYGDDVNGIFYNPALLNDRMHRALSVSYLNYMSDINAGFLAYARQFSTLGTIGAGIRFLNWGELQGADEEGNLTEKFGASDVALTVGAARSYSDHLFYGISTHFIYTSVEAYNAAAVAADLGIVYYLPDQEMAFSASLNNFGLTLNSLGSLDDELPLDVRIGISKRLQYIPLLLSVTGYNLHDIENASGEGKVVDRIMQFVAFGGEFQFSDTFNLRFGYNHRRHEALKMKSRLDMAGVGVGFGIKVSRVNVDYAYNTWSSVGGLHHFTVRTKI